MTHDPMCPSLGKGALPVIDLCRCGLIALVRQDEYAVGYSAAMEDGWGGYDAALRDAVAAVQASVEPWPVGAPGAIPKSWAIAAIEALRGE